MRRTAVTLLAAVAVAAVPGQAAAAPELVVSELRVDEATRTVDLTAAAAGLPPGVGLDSGSVTAAVDGRGLPTTVRVVDAEATTQAPRLMLIVDTSGSMQGEPMRQAKDALASFVAAVPVAVEVGLLPFGSRPQPAVPPSTDRSRVLGAISGLRASGETSLYDAVLAGLTALGADGDRRMVVLSDGGDTSSTAQLPAVLAAAESSGIVVDAIGFKTDESVQDVLQQVTAAGNGRLHGVTDVAQLTQALSTTTRTVAQSLAISVLVPDDVDGTRELALTVSTPVGAVTTTTLVDLGVRATPNTPDRSWWSTRDALLVGVAAIALSLLLGSLALMDGSRRDQRRAVSAIERFTVGGTPEPQAESLRTASPVTRTAIGLADKVVTSRGLQDRMGRRLERAAVPLTPAEWLLVLAGSTLLTTFVLVLLGTGLAGGLLVGAILGVLVPELVLRMRASGRQRTFQDGLPDTLQLVAGSLAAGYSLAQSLDGVVREGTEPMRGEFGRALAESRLGVPVETTLQGVAQRMDSRDFAWVVMAIRVQREVGGNLAGVLTTVASTMRERAMLRRHVRALSAEGRLSAYILLGLPVFLALYLFATQRSYLEPLYTTGLGVGFLVTGLVLMVVGSFAMSRLVKVEV